MTPRRFTFVFSVPQITVDVEMPEDCEEGSDDYMPEYIDAPCAHCETVLSVQAALEARVQDLLEELCRARNETLRAEHEMDRAQRNLRNAKAQMQMDRERADIKAAAARPARRKKT